MHSNYYNPSRLDASFGFMMKHLPWVPQNPPATPKVEHVTLSNKLLPRFHSPEYHGWQFTITLDEPRFYLSTDQEHISFCLEEHPPEKP
jgi:hypothetical protein